MSPIALVMNLVLALLLLAALGFGVRLERRLKALRDGQATFVDAIADLDRAARRAEQGLAELRQATDETVDLLAGRIENARELVARLDGLVAAAARPIARAPQPAPAPTRPSPRAFLGDAPDRAELDAEDLVLKLSEKQVIAHPRPGRFEPRATPRSRASVDDDLFDQSPRAAAGGRR